MTRLAIQFRPDLETIAPGEAKTQAALVEALGGIITTVHADSGHAFRSVHAKGHALLEGEMTVLPGLSAELAQGIFAAPATYPVLARISTNAGDVLPDSISLPRGLAIKVIGVEGARLPGSEGATTQDFVLAVGKAFPTATAEAFLKNLKLLAATTDRVEGLKKVVSAVFRGTEKAIEAVGGESGLLKALGGYRHTHPLGERYFSQAPIRYGDHVAKIGIVPLSENFKALEGHDIAIGGRDDALREEIAGVLAQGGGTWEVRVQLCRDLALDPIEDASVPWPEDDNPYVAVATISIPPQDSWSAGQVTRIDDGTAFSPWHGIAAHQPLGNIMRARKPPYAASAQLRGTLNGCPMHEPSALREPA